MNTPRLLPIALATPRTNFLGPPAVGCELGLHREKKCWTSSNDRAINSAFRIERNARWLRCLLSMSSIEVSPRLVHAGTQQ